MGHVSLLAGGLALLLCLASPLAHAVERGRTRTVRGILYFTNNSPPKSVYHFKLYTRDMKRVVAAQRPNGGSDFEFRNIRPGRYVLTVTGLTSVTSGTRLTCAASHRPGCASSATPTAGPAASRRGKAEGASVADRR